VLRFWGKSIWASAVIRAQQANPRRSTYFGWTLMLGVVPVAAPAQAPLKVCTFTFLLRRIQ
jgi:hypothetical protein